MPRRATGTDDATARAKSGKQHLELRTSDGGSIDAAGFRIETAGRACKGEATVYVSSFVKKGAHIAPLSGIP